MNTVECTLHWNVDILLVNLTVSASVLGVANTCSIVAPPSISTIIGACLDAAIDSSKSRLTPTSSIQAQTVVRAVADANWN